MVNTKRRKAIGNYGKLKIYNLSGFELQQVRSVLWSLPSDIINKGDTNTTILDTGWSRSDTGFIYEFMEGNLVQLYQIHLMDVIGDSLKSPNEWTLHYEVINEKRKFSVL